MLTITNNTRQLLNRRSKHFATGGSWFDRNAGNLFNTAIGAGMTAFVPGMQAQGIGMMAGGVGGMIGDASAPNIEDPTVAYNNQIMNKRNHSMNNRINPNSLYLATGGRLMPEASNAAIARGNTHEQGGIQIPGGEIEDNETIVQSPYDGSTQVHSDKLGYADESNQLVDQKGKLEYKLSNLTKQLQGLQAEMDSVNKSIEDGGTGMLNRNKAKREYQKLAKVYNDIEFEAASIQDQIQHIDAMVEQNFQQQEEEAMMMGMRDEQGMPTEDATGMGEQPRFDLGTPDLKTYDIHFDRNTGEVIDQFNPHTPTPHFRGYPFNPLGSTQGASFTHNFENWESFGIPDAPSSKVGDNPRFNIIGLTSDDPYAISKYYAGARGDYPYGTTSWMPRRNAYRYSKNMPYTDVSLSDGSRFDPNNRFNPVLQSTPDSQFPTTTFDQLDAVTPSQTQQIPLGQTTRTRTQRSTTPAQQTQQQQPERQPTGYGANNMMPSLGSSMQQTRMNKELQSLANDPYLNDYLNNQHFEIDDPESLGRSAGLQKSDIHTPTNKIDEINEGTNWQNALPFISNAYNSFANARMRRLNTPQGRMIQAPTMDARVNINPQVDAIRSQVRSGEEAITSTTSNAAVSRANRASLAIQGGREEANVRGQADNTSRQIRNHNLDRTMQADMMNQQTDFYNQQIQDQTDRQAFAATSANIANIESKLQQFVNQGRMKDFQDAQLALYDKLAGDTSIPAELRLAIKDVSSPEDFIKLLNDNNITGEHKEHLISEMTKILNNK